MVPILLRTARIAKVLLRKSLVSKPRARFIAKAQDEFRAVVKELKIPSGLEPKLKMGKFPGLGGGYLPNQHTVLVNSHLPWYLNLWAKVSGRNFVRHELKHAEQWLSVAGHGLNHKLPATIQLNSQVADLAHKTFKLTGAAGQARLELLANPGLALDNWRESTIHLNNMRGRFMNKILGGFKSIKKRVPVKTSLPVTATAKSKSFTITAPTFTLKAREMLGSSKSVTLKQSWSDYRAARSSFVKAKKTYCDDICEVEARRFEKKSRSLFLI